MTAQIEIAYQGFSPTQANQTFVREHVGKLEKLFDRAVSCSVVIASPSARHRNDGFYRVSIRLKLPSGKEIDVSRVDNSDERLADFHFAVGDAFRRAKRQLRSKAQQIRGEVKAHRGQGQE